MRLARLQDAPHHPDVRIVQPGALASRPGMSKCWTDTLSREVLTGSGVVGGVLVGSEVVGGGVVGGVLVGSNVVGGGVVGGMVVGAEVVGGGVVGGVSVGAEVVGGGVARLW